MADTLARVKCVTAEVLKLDPADIADNATFVEDLGAASVQSLELVAAFEEEFDIEMDEDAALGVTNIAGAAVFIDRIMNAGK